MKKSVKLLSIVGLPILLFGCGKKTTTEQTNTLPPVGVVKIQSNYENVAKIKGEGSYYYGNQATIKVDNTIEGYEFVEWIDLDTNTTLSNNNEYYLAINKENYNLMAKFKLKEYDIRYEIYDAINNPKNKTKYTIEDEVIFYPAEKEGYDFEYWYYYTGDPNNVKVEKIEKGSTGSKLLYAQFKLSDDTEYKVNYYLQNIENDQYSFEKTVKLSGTTMDMTSFEPDEYAGFKLKAYENKRIAPDGSTEIDLYYEREFYDIDVKDSVYSDTSLPISGSYKYGTILNINSGDGYLGYSYDGIYCNGESISSSTSYDFEVGNFDANIVIKYDVLSEMEMFNFTSTKDTCVINGVNNPNITELVIPEYITNIDIEAFKSNCFKVKKVTTSLLGHINDDDTISPFAWFFIYDTRPSSETYGQYYLPSSIEEIIVLNNTVINKYCFSYCKNVKKISFPSNVTSIGEGAFNECNSLTNVTLPQGIETVPKNCFYNCNSIKSIIIPNSVTSLGEYAFYNCGFKSIDLPANLKTIGMCAFWNANLESIELPESLESIATQAFSGCKIKGLVIPNKITIISPNAFSSIEELEYVVLPKSVSNISAAAFYNCISLSKVYYYGDEDEYALITIRGNNDYLTASTVYYYSSESPEEPGNYWHMDDEAGKPVAW